MYRPKAQIGIFLMNSNADKIILGKKFGDGFLTLPTGMVSYGDAFEESAVKILYNQLSLLVEEERLVEICSYNALDKKKKYHSVEVDFLLKLNEKEEALIVNNDTFSYENWEWYNFNELLEAQSRLLCPLQIFLSKFEIKAYDDILKMGIAY